MATTSNANARFTKCVGTASSPGSHGTRGQESGGPKVVPGSVSQENPNIAPVRTAQTPFSPGMFHV